MASQKKFWVAFSLFPHTYCQTFGYNFVQQGRNEYSCELYQNIFGEVINIKMLHVLASAMLEHEKHFLLYHCWEHFRSYYQINTRYTQEERRGELSILIAVCQLPKTLYLPMFCLIMNSSALVNSPLLRGTLVRIPALCLEVSDSMLWRYLLVGFNSEHLVPWSQWQVL